ncbi:unnamed protein product [Ambrosiozyma monospora]|uniref:Unnamed protein product n=1 Tax=Ambrosiozyma monospora TaxID=43982 RepID=A0ACB5T0U5_AMBMO|nr:unnamed protein product [Ambrosiozyma monospora]
MFVREPSSENPEVTYFEDLLILRCYSGDTYGSQIVFNAIIENIIQQLKGCFQIEINEHCIINQDQYFPHEKSFVFFNRAGITVKTYKQVADIYKIRKTRKELMKDLLHGWLDMTYESRKFSYSNRTNASICFHPFIYKNKFVISRPLNRSNNEVKLTGQVMALTYPSSVDRALMLIFSELITSMLTGNATEICENASYFIEWVNYYSLPCMLLMAEQFFKDRDSKLIASLFTKAISAIELNRITIDAPNVLSKNELYDKSDNRELKKGDVLENSGKYHIIVGFLKDDGVEFCLCFDDQGDLTISRMNNARQIVTDDESIVVRFGFYDELGRFFNHFDSVTHTFV